MREGDALLLSFLSQGQVPSSLVGMFEYQVSPSSPILGNGSRTLDLSWGVEKGKTQCIA